MARSVFVVVSLSFYAVLAKYCFTHLPRSTSRSDASREDDESPLAYMLFVAEMQKTLGLPQKVDDVCSTPSGNSTSHSPMSVKYVRWSDALSAPWLQIYHFARGIIGTSVLLCVVIPLIVAHMCHSIGRAWIIDRKRRVLGSPVKLHGPSFWSKQHLGHCVRMGFSELYLLQLLVPVQERGWRWRAIHLLADAITLLEYLPFAKKPIALFSECKAAYCRDGNAVFPFGDGISFANHRDIVAWQKRSDIIKGKASVGWTCSDSQSEFASHLPLHLASAKDHPDYFRFLHGKAVIVHWIKQAWSVEPMLGRLHSPPNEVLSSNPWMNSLLEMVPRYNSRGVSGSGMPGRDAVWSAYGNVQFFLLTQGGQLTREERVAYIDLVINPMHFMSNWVNFLVGGGVLERKGCRSMLAIREALHRCRHAQTISSTLAFAEKLGIDAAEVYRLLAIVYAIAGGPAPPKLCYAILERLYSDPARMVPLWRRAPRKFMLECARLDKLVPAVTFYTTDPLSFTFPMPDCFDLAPVRHTQQGVEGSVRTGARTVHVDPSLPLRLCHTTAGFDETVFSDPYRFDVDRDNLGELTIWAAPASIHPRDEPKQCPFDRSVDGKRSDPGALPTNPASTAPRYCPGRDFGLDTIQWIVERMMPTLDGEILTLPLQKSQQLDPMKVVTPLFSQDLADMSNGGYDGSKMEEIKQQESPAPATPLSPLVREGASTAIDTLDQPVHADIRTIAAGSASTEADTAHAELSATLLQARLLQTASIRRSLDSYTKAVLQLMMLAAMKWNDHAPAGVDIKPPSDVDLWYPTQRRKNRRQLLASTTTLDTYPHPTTELQQQLVVPFSASAKAASRVFGVLLPEYDEDIGAHPLLRRLARWWVNSTFTSRIEFVSCFFPSTEIAVHFRQDVFGTLLPALRHHFDELSSDACMTRLAFSGPSCHYMIKLDTAISERCTHNGSAAASASTAGAAGWMTPQAVQHAPAGTLYIHDVSMLSAFSVRAPFERYGAIAYFDAAFQPLGIYWSHAARRVSAVTANSTPGDLKNWLYAKYVWRASWFAQVTINDHLVVSHLVEGNALARCSREFLSARHPLRIFLKPYTYHTISINFQASRSLVNPAGLFHRIWAFDYSTLEDIVAHILRQRRQTNARGYKWQEQRIHHSMCDVPDSIFPIQKDMREVWEAVRQHVAAFFSIYYPTPQSSPGQDYSPSNQREDLLPDYLC